MAQQKDSLFRQLLPLFLVFLVASSHAHAVSGRVSAGALHARLSESTQGLARVARMVATARDRADSDLWHPRAADGTSLLADGSGADAVHDIMDQRNHAPLLQFVQELAKRDSGDDEDKGWWDRATGYVSDKYDAVTGSTMEAAERALSSVRNRAESVDAGDVVGAVVFGLVNGLLLGMAGAVRDDIRRSKVECAAGASRVKGAFEGVSGAISHFASGVIDSESSARGGAGLKDFVKSASTRFLASMGVLFGETNEYVSECEPVRRILGMVFLLILVGVIFTILLMAFPVIGWIVKIAGALITLFFAGAFALTTAKKLVRAVGDNSRQGTIDLIEATCEFGGILISVFVLSGIQGIAKDASIAAKFNGSSLARKFNLRYSTKTASEAAALEGAVSAAKSGSPGAVSKLTSAGKSAAETSTRTSTTTSTSTSTATTASTKAGASTGAKIVDDVVKPNKPEVRASYDKSAHRWRNEANGQFHKTPGGLKWDAKVNRWRAPNGQFAKQPSNVWPKWDSNVQRWRDHLGRFAKSPIDDSVKWEKNTQRFREIDSGRFAKNPSENHSFYVLEKGSTRAVPIEQVGATKIVPVNPSAASSAANAANAETKLVVLGTHQIIESDADVPTNDQIQDVTNRRGGGGGVIVGGEEEEEETKAEEIAEEEAREEDDSRDGINVSFPFDSSCARGIGAKAAKAASEAGAHTVYIAGHTDAQGPEGYNFALSKRRAVNAAGALRAAGFEGKIEIAWYGESRVEASKGHAFNRRVVIATHKPSGWLEPGMVVAQGEGVDGATACE